MQADCRPSLNQHSTKALEKIFLPLSTYSFDIGSSKMPFWQRILVLLLCARKCRNRIDRIPL